VRSQKTIVRRPERHTVRLCCQVVRERDFRLVADRVENLSTWGMLVSPAEPVLTGERVFVSFQIPGTRHYIDTMATVTRVAHGRRPTEFQRMLGLEFDQLSPYDRFRLKSSLRGRPLAPPGTRPGRRSDSFAIWTLLHCQARESALT